MRFRLTLESEDPKTGVQYVLTVPRISNVEWEESTIDDADQLRDVGQIIARDLLRKKFKLIRIERLSE